MICLSCVGLLFSLQTNAQFPIKGGRMPGSGMISAGGKSGGSGAGGKDSLSFEKRDFNENKVSIQYRLLDTARYRALDTAIILIKFHWMQNIFTSVIMEQPHNLFYSNP